MVNEPYLIDGVIPQSLANLIRESKGESATTKYLPAQFYSELRTIINSGRYLIKSASGAVASFNDAIAAPLVGLRVALPYSAEGHVAVQVTRTGRNLLDDSSPTWPRTFLDAQCNLVPNNAYNTWRFDGGIKYCFSFTPGTTFDAIRYGLILGDAGQRTTASNSPIIMDATNYDFLYLCLVNRDSFVSNAQLEIGSTATAYEPYSGETHTITLPTTIYGGYLDVVTGQLVATHDADGNLLTNQKVYFIDTVNVSALAGVNNVWSDAGDAAVSYRIDNG